MFLKCFQAIMSANICPSVFTAGFVKDSCILINLLYSKQGENEQINFVLIRQEGM